jgi:hypothetical protein
MSAAPGRHKQARALMGGSEDMKCPVWGDA